MEGPYRVELIESACEKCGKGAMWGIVDADDEECTGTLYCNQEDAEEDAELMNRCYIEGSKHRADQVEGLVADLRGILAKHRVEAYFTCPDDCWCWDLDNAISKYEARLNG